MNIDGKTKLLGLIGTPVEHSKSPAMYNYCFDKYGLNCAYLAFDVDMDHVADAVAALRTFHVMGCNVTMPLKNAVIPYLDEVSPASRAIGSVNTIVNKDGKLYGYVTDGMGYTGELRRGGVEVAGQGHHPPGRGRRCEAPSPSRPRSRAPRRSACSTSATASGRGPWPTSRPSATPLPPAR